LNILQDTKIYSMLHGIVVLSLTKTVKGLVHPKMKMMSLMSHPHVVISL